MSTLRLSVLAWGLFFLQAFAQQTPEGLWQTYNDANTQAQSWVRIERQGDHWVGKIEKIVDPDVAPNEVCKACKGPKKGQPLQGLTIIEGVPVQATSKSWRGGKILDPENGQEYRLDLELSAQGAELMVRGYWGPFWRTQHWRRMTP
jgi:uncharacterized protein (DUF2147 family)